MAIKNSVSNILLVDRIKVFDCRLSSVLIDELMLYVPVVMYNFRIDFFVEPVLRRSGSVVECLTQDRGAAGSSLTGATGKIINPS